MKSTQKKVDDRGHDAEKPHQFPVAGWKDIGKRVLSEMKNDHVQIVAAGVGFYFFLALFPTIVAAISIYSLVLDTSQIQEQISRLSAFLPDQAYGMIREILQPVLEQSNQEIGWGLAFSIGLSLWSANKGTSALFEGINIAYDEKDTRGIIKKNLITLLFTLGAVVLGLLSLLFIIFFPILIEKVGLSSQTEQILGWLRWIVLGAILVISLGVVYKIAPNRSNPQFRWVSVGSVLGTILWLGGSLLFSWYVKNFGSYDDLYGSFSAVIILMLWLFLTAFIVLLGAEINSEMEHQTTYDTTIGEQKPMGERGAYHADHVAKDRDKKF
jgi:membrane protein